eukprot:COSAG01_NODE_7162_length_3324_cov_2.125891_2_plen_568_part_00
MRQDTDPAAAALAFVEQSGPRSPPSLRSVFGFGFTAGFCMMTAIGIAFQFMDVRGSQGATLASVWEPKYLFFAYRPHLQICLCVWFWGANIFVFQRYRVNHVLVLGLSPSAQQYLHPSTVLLLASVWSVAALLSFWVQVSHAWVWLTSEPESPPIVVWVLVLGFFCFPSRASWSLWSTRRRIVRTLGRVLMAGFVPVMWRDVLLANILSSLVKPLVDLNHFICYSTTESFFEEGHSGLALKLGLPIDGCGCLTTQGMGYSSTIGGCAEGHTTNSTEQELCLQADEQGEMDKCNDYSTFDAVVTFLPYWFRFMQQCRRYIDSKCESKKDLVNAGKYFTSLCVVTLSWADHTFSSQYAGHDLSKWDVFASPWKAGWAVAVVICAVYKLIWDIKQDWKLGVRDSPHWGLRPRLTYPAWFYYYCILQDTVLRFNWVLTISPSYFHLESVSQLWWSTSAATLEVVRRFTWTLLRIEAEHVTNVGKTRAFNEVPLPTLERLRLVATQAEDAHGGIRASVFDDGVDDDEGHATFSTFGDDVPKGGLTKRRFSRGRRPGQSLLLRADMMAQTTVT